MSVTRAIRRSTLEVAGPIAEIGLDQHGPLNLVTKAMLRALNASLAEVAAHGDVRCVIVHGGSARAFCAGSDIKEFEHLRARRERAQDPVRGHGAAGVLRGMPMPTIAAIDGTCAGRRPRAGARLRPARLRQGRRAGTHRSRGSGALAGSGVDAPDAARRPGAREADAVHGRNDVTDEVALAWGLVNRIVVDGTAARRRAGAGGHDRRARPVVEPAGQGARRCGAGSPARCRVVDVDHARNSEIFDSSDLHEGVAAFFAKRDPRIQGTMSAMEKITADEAAQLIEDGDAILISGSGGGHAVPETLLAAVERRFLAEGKPRGLTSVSVVGVGDRAALGASHLAHEGLLRRAITSALVDSPGLVRLAAEDKIEAYTFPQGVLSQLMRDMAAGRPGLIDARRDSTRSSIRASRARGRARARRRTSSRW